MGITAEIDAKQLSVTREEQDVQFATSSQNKTKTSQKGDVFKDEIALKTRKGNICIGSSEQ